jgi:response regulator of citrate/malate metabolism
MDKLKILIIEDQPEMNPRSIGRLKDHYEVTIANSVNSVRNYLRTGLNFELIFLDIMLPPYPYKLDETNNGLETGWVLYQKELKYKNVKIILWSSFHDILYKKEWGTNVVDRVVKSMDDFQLVDLAHKHLKSI